MSIDQAKEKRLRDGEAGSDLAEKAMYVLAILLALVSGYTTLQGMLRIFGNSNPVLSSPDAFFSTAAAFVITAVVQAALTVLCWVLGKDLARAFTAKMHESNTNRQTTGAKIGRYTMMGVLVLLCLLISAFFSFNTYFNGLYKGDEERRIAEASVPDFGIEVGSILNQAVAEFRSSRRDEIMNAVRDSGYVERMNLLAQTAEANKGKLEDRVRQLNQERIDAEKEKIRLRIEAEQLTDKSRRSLGENQARIAEIDEETKRLNEGIEGLRGQIRELRDREKAARDEAECERAGCDGRKPGTGTKFNAALAEATKADRDAKALDNRINADLDSINKLGNERTELAIRVEQAQLDLAAAKPEAGTEPEASAQDGSQTKPGVAPQAENTTTSSPALPKIENVDQNIAELNKAVKAFDSLPTQERLQQVSNLCSDLATAISEDAELATQFNVEQCKIGQDALLQDINAFSKQNEQLNGFSAKCANINTDALTLETAIPELRDCYSLALKAGVPRQQPSFAEANDAISTFQQRYDPTQHEFLKTLRAFSVSPLLAVLAAFIAGVQDIAVFIMTFIVEFFKRERTYVRSEELGRFLSGSERGAIEKLMAGLVPVPNVHDRYAFVFDDAKKARMTDDEVKAINDILFDLRARKLLETPSATEFQLLTEGYNALKARLRDPEKRETAQALRDSERPADRREGGNVSRPESRESGMNLGDGASRPPEGLTPIERAAWIASRKRQAAGRNVPDDYSTPPPQSSREKRFRRQQEGSEPQFQSADRDSSTGFSGTGKPGPSDPDGPHVQSARADRDPDQRQHGRNGEERTTRAGTDSEEDKDPMSSIRDILNDITSN
ncbi:MAG: hypothetical protein R3D32_01235 [Nitratireductor sp.]